MTSHQLKFLPCRFASNKKGHFVLPEMKGKKTSMEIPTDSKQYMRWRPPFWWQSRFSVFMGVAPCGALGRSVNFYVVYYVASLRTQ